MTAATGQQLRLEIKRELAHSRERVFAALTEPDRVMRWFGPPGVLNLDATVELRVGGTYRFTVRGVNDGPVYTVSGVYTEIVPPERLRFTWKWDQSPPEAPAMEVCIDLTPSATGCTLALTQTGFASQDDCDRHTHGWNGSFERLCQLGG